LTDPKIGPKRCAACGHVLGAEQKPLTQLQAQVLKVIGDHVAAQGCAPTFEELKDVFNWKSTGTVAMHIAALEAKGYIRREPKNARGITVLVTFDEIGSIPVETKHD
jgi:repressor LexA